jgi:outer membrane receptor protein involved in Fe transport
MNRNSKGKMNPDVSRKKHRSAVNSGLVILVLLALSALSINAVAAEDGRITGTVLNQETGEPIIGATVMIQGTQLGSMTDLDGNYSIKRVPYGTYTLMISSVGYQRMEVTQVVVDTKTALRLDFAISREDVQLDKVTVSARRVENTQAVMLKHRQASTSVSDAISAEEISRSGSGDAAEAMTKVTGVSVIGGKDLVIRGMGDRYTTTNLNGSTLPSPDPDRQSTPMDLVPAGLLDNIVVEKSFTPDKPGNFAGGSVNLTTKDYPEQRTLKVSSSFGRNNVTTGETIKTHDPSSKDWLGYDSGKRSIPGIVLDNPELQAMTPNAFTLNYDSTNELLSNYIPMTWDEFSDLTAYMDQSSRAWNPEMRVSERTAPANQSHSVAFGDNIPLFDRPLGVVATYSYSKKYSSSNGASNLYRRVSDIESLGSWYTYSDSGGTEDVLWGSLISLNYGVARNHKLGFSFVHNQNGTSDSRFLYGPNQEHGQGDNIINHALQYTERHISSTQFSGDHVLSKGGLRLDWSFSYATTAQKQPDTRYITVVDKGNLQEILLNLFNGPRRLHRELDENNREYKVNLTMPVGPRSKIKFGAAHLNTNRYYREREFRYANTSAFKRYNGDIDAYTHSMGLDSLSRRQLPNGTVKYAATYFNFITEVENHLNQYIGRSDITGVYGMLETPIIGNFFFVGGARLEATDMYTLTDTIPSILKFGEGVIHERDWLPSANVIWRTSDAMNIRLSYGRTVARPTLKEMTPTAFQTYGSSIYEIGSDSLRMSKISNWDLRWEWFVRPGEVLAFTAFHKSISDPIGYTSIGSNGNVLAVNSAEATVYGIEIEARRRLDVIHNTFRNFWFGGNFTLASSDVDKSPQEMIQIENADLPHKVDDRPLWGQSDYIVNFDISYENWRTGTALGLFANTFGDRLRISSSGRTPDVYEESRWQLDFVASQKIFGPSLKFSIKNLLNEDYRLVYKDYFYHKDGKVMEVYQEYKRGVTWSLGLSFDVF